MRIGIIYMHPFSESMGSSVRVRELAFGLSKSGAEVFILAPYEKSFDLAPKVHVVSVSAMLTNLGLSLPLYKVCKFLYYSSLFPELFASTNSSSNGLMGILTRDMVKMIIQLKIDVIQVEQDAAIPIGIAIKRKTGLPLVADIHNISSEELVAAKVIQRNSARFKKLQSETKRCLLEADHVAVVSESMASYIVENYGLIASKISVVPPGGRLSKVSHSDEKSLLRVVYAGLVAKREHVDLFIKSIPRVAKAKTNVKFYVTNKGEAIGDIKRLSKQLGVDAEFFWYDDYLEVSRFISSCQVGILPSSNDIARRMGTPIKLFTYLEMGVPVVANNVGGWSEIIERNQVGIVCPDDPQHFSDAILDLIQDHEKILQFRKNGIELIKKQYNWENSGRLLLNACNGLYE